MFLHRSFYQYFFSCYLYRFIKDINAHTLSKADLAFFGRRRISRDVFDYLNQLHDDNDKETLSNNGDAIVKILTKTDSILFLENNHILNNKISIIDQAGNTFCNIISLLSILNVLPKDALNTAVYVSDLHYYRRPLLNCLKRYSAHGIILKNAIVNQEIANSSPSFRNAVIINVDFNNSDYKGSDFSQAIIINDNFKKTDLRGASFSGTDINDTDFSDANLSGASFSDIVLNRCTMVGTNFRGASFSNVTFSNNCTFYDVDFRGASFSNVLFECNNLDEVDFSGAILSDVNMVDAIIDNAIFDGASFSGTVLPKTLANEHGELFYSTTK